MAQAQTTSRIGDDTQDTQAAETRSFAKLFWNQLKRNPLVIAALVILALLYAMMGASFLLEDFPPYDPNKPFVGPRLEGPSPEHWFGTDHLGRDLFSRVVVGSQISLNIGILVALLSVSIGTLLGSVAGYFGGWIDSLIMRFTDIVLNFPFLFFAITLVTILQPNFWNIVLAIGLLSWTSIARIVRANFLSLREREFVLAAHSLGAPARRIIIRHILPNTVAPLIVYATLTVGIAIIAEAGLSYLGLGVQPPTPSWGNMLQQGKPYISSHIWFTLFPGLFIFVTVMCVNYLGDGLRDALDPKIVT
ncbi:MAG: ABC transporter permease [Candidatus Bipolaricaulia bacterium]